MVTRYVMESKSQFALIMRPGYVDRFMRNTVIYQGIRTTIHLDSENSPNDGGVFYSQ